jgi:hypothetical protein
MESPENQNTRHASRLSPLAVGLTALAVLEPMAPIDQMLQILKRKGE